MKLLDRKTVQNTKQAEQGSLIRTSSILEQQIANKNKILNNLKDQIRELEEEIGEKQILLSKKEIETEKKIDNKTRTVLQDITSKKQSLIEIEQKNIELQLVLDKKQKEIEARELELIETKLKLRDRELEIEKKEKEIETQAKFTFESGKMLDEAIENYKINKLKLENEKDAFEKYREKEDADLNKRLDESRLELSQVVAQKLLIEDKERKLLALNEDTKYQLNRLYGLRRELSVDNPSN